VELKAVLNEINARKGGREMTIDEVLMHIFCPIDMFARSSLALFLLSFPLAST
jgi:hypothetical protein